jgi:hypothetical protein
VGGSPSSDVRIRVRSLTIVAVQANLPGPIVERMTATGLSAGGTAGRQTLGLRLRNDGNRLLVGHGTLTITDSSRRSLKRIPFKLDTLVPHTAINYPIPVVGRALRKGTYGVLLTLAYGHGQGLRYATNLTITTGELRRVFGPHAPELTPEGNHSSAAIVLVIGGLGGLMLGGLIAALARRRASS